MIDEKEFKRVQKNLELYQKAVNKIDDYFEYRNESAKDRNYIYGILLELSESLKKVNNLK